MAQIKQANFRQPWTQIQDQILTSLVKKYGTKNWVLISEKMDSKANTNSRTGKQCRQRWHNHLDPSISRKTWSLQEQRTMFQAHKKYGNKWADIASELKGRTDSDVKNRFYSVLRKCLRRVSKMLGQKNSTEKIKNIKPSHLSKLIGNKNDVKSRETSEALFKFIFQRENMNANSLEKNSKELLMDLISKISTLSQKGLSSSQKSQDDQNKEIQVQKVSKKSLLRLSSKRLRNVSDNRKEPQMIVKKALRTRKIKKISRKGSQKRTQNQPQKQNNMSQIQQLIQEIQFPQKMQQSKRISSLFSNISPQSNFKSPTQNQDQSLRITRRNSAFRETCQDERLMFGELFSIPDNLLRRRSSSNLGDMRRIMSNNQMGTIYVTPRNPTPGFSQNLFPSWNLPGKITIESIDQQTQRIRKQIERNIHSRNM